MSKKPIVFAFIDSQNLNLGVQSQGWKLDYKKFRLYLKNKYNVQQAFIFIGLVTGNDELYKQLQRAGFILIFKPTVRYFENGKQTVKGNVDAELVLHAAAIEYENYDKAIIVSGDGDFAASGSTELSPAIGLASGWQAAASRAQDGSVSHRSFAPAVHIRPMPCSSTSRSVCES